MQETETLYRSRDIFSPISLSFPTQYFWPSFGSIVILERRKQHCASDMAGSTIAMLSYRCIDSPVHLVRSSDLRSVHNSLHVVHNVVAVEWPTRPNSP
jgi:hypothetical protein